MNISPELLDAVTSLIVPVLSLIVTIIAVRLSADSNRRAERSAITQSTDVIFKEWWSEEGQSLRRYFFSEFVPRFRARLTGKGVREIGEVVPEDAGRAAHLCSFFDRVGWLGAAGLIDVDYVLGPMQHVMRRVWMVMEPLILEERKGRPGQPLDPCYQYGFEWLFDRSNQRNKHQANLLRRKFLRRNLRTSQEMADLQAQMDADEADFRGELAAVLGQGGPKV